MVDRLKREFYLRLDVLRRCEEPRSFSPGVHVLAENFPDRAVGGRGQICMPSRARSWRATTRRLDRLIALLAKEIDLNASTRDIDDLLASLDPAEWHPEARREVLVNYLGFPFWDVLTFPVTSGRDTGELSEILVDRISPQTCIAQGFEGSAKACAASASAISPRSSPAAIGRTTICWAGCTPWSRQYVMMKYIKKKILIIFLMPLVHF